MKNAAFTVFKKEMKRFFSDKKMIIMILLPGLMIFLMYNVMGSTIGNMVASSSEYLVYSENMPESIKTTLSSLEEVTIENVDVDTLSINNDDVKQQLADGSGCDAFIVFPENFETDILNYDIASGEKAPQMEIFYNSSDTDSQAAFAMLSSVMEGYENAMTNKFDINSGSAQYDLADEKDMTGMFFSSLMPMLILIFLYSGCMAVAVESIAGEKEKGTIATMLVTPVKRSSIAIGKICALSIVALLSGASSTIGTVTSLPKLVGDDSDMLNGNFYTASDYIMLAVVILATVLFLVTILSIISAMAKSVKEAQTYVLPVMIIVMVIGFSGMFSSAPDSIFVYMIPLYNSVQSIANIFSFNLNFANIAVTVVSNLVYTGIGIFALTKIFNSEKIMF